MSTTKHKIVVAITGASGAVYAKVLMDKLVQLQDQIEEVGVILSDNAKIVWEYELGNTDYEKLPFKIFDKKDFNAPFASGSAKFKTMVVCPCSMGTMGRIAHGV
ncbi:MAG TPA: 3-octaprenyl-4-hydroxybenzoate carboxy-lyase, partial [Flavobacteriales bacterium]|nr:3-octaprenyl-4-hydroxybenzoate carboxy-lyase [Flavobacteriales bacterium]